MRQILCRDARDRVKPKVERVAWAMVLCRGAQGCARSTTRPDYASAQEKTPRYLRTEGFWIDVHGWTNAAKAMDGRERRKPGDLQQDQQVLTMEGLMSRSTWMCESDHRPGEVTRHRKSPVLFRVRGFGIKAWR